MSFSGGGYDWLKLWICSFHMPLFFIVYGIVAGYRKLHSFIDWKNYLIDKGKALLVPYGLWALIYANGINVKTLLGIGYGTSPTLCNAESNGILWFLPAMFVSTILFQIVLNIIENHQRKIAYIVAVCVICIIVAKSGSYVQGIRLPWGTDIAFLGVVFMLIGKYVVKETMDLVIKTTIGKRYLLCVCLLGIGVLIAVLNQPVHDVYNVTVMALAIYGKSIVLLIVGSTASVLLVLIFCYLTKGKLFSYLGQHSLLMFAVHTLISKGTLPLVLKIFRSQPGLTIPIAFLNSVLITVICIPLCYIVDEFCPCLNGKR